MIPEPFNLHSDLVSQTKIWSTDSHVKFNDQELTVMRLEGQFYWHVHGDSDEMFLVVDGDVFVETREGSTDISEDGPGVTSRWLRKGDVFVVPRNTAHRSSAPTGASVLFGLKKNALLFMKDDAKEAEMDPVAGESDGEGSHKGLEADGLPKDAWA